jgi:hypothetical protein
VRDETGAATVMTAVLALAMGAVSSTAGAEEASTKIQSQNDASKFSYVRLYCGPDHETHFAGLTAELAEQNFAPPAAPIYIGGKQPSSSVFFAGFGPHWGAADLANHLYHPSLQSSSSPWPRAYSPSQRRMGRRGNCMLATWSIWRTSRLAKGTSRSWAKLSDFWCSRAEPRSEWRRGRFAKCLALSSGLFLASIPCPPFAAIGGRKTMRVFADPYPRALN